MATVRLRAHDDGLGGHESTGGVVGVAQQLAHWAGVLGLHQFQQCRALRCGQVAEQVGRVVGIHGLEHVGRAVGTAACRNSAIWSSSGNSSSTSASRSSSSAAAISAEREGDISMSAAARSAGLWSAN